MRRFFIAALLISPLLPWLPMLSLSFPGLGLPRYDPSIGAFLWQIHLWLGLWFGFACFLLWPNDRWLALGVAYIGLGVFLRGGDVVHGVFFSVGALLLVTIRTFAMDLWHPMRRAVIAIAVFEWAYVLIQFTGHDPLWGPLFGGNLKEQIQPLGTLGSVNATAFVLAIAAGLCPLGPMVVFGITILWMKSLGAMLAFLIGGAVAFWPQSVAVQTGAAEKSLGVRMMGWTFYRPRANYRLELGIALLAGGLIAFMVSYLHKFTQVARLEIWHFAVSQWLQSPMNVIFGWGIGGWQRHIPGLQQQLSFFPTHELWAEAHNEPLQWVMETGIVGAIIFIGWLIKWAPVAFRSPWAGAAAALLVSTFSWHTFHLGVLSLVGVVIAGMSTYREDNDHGIR